jgi:hypothetical protein
LINLGVGLIDISFAEFLTGMKFVRAKKVRNCVARSLRKLFVGVHLVAGLDDEIEDQAAPGTGPRA